MRVLEDHPHSTLFQLLRILARSTHGLHPLSERTLSGTRADSVVVAGGVIPKKWAIATQGRPAALGSKNELTSIPRSLGIPGMGAVLPRLAFGFIGGGTMAVGMWNFGVFTSGLVYAAVPGSTPLPTGAESCGGD